MCLRRGEGVYSFTGFGKKMGFLVLLIFFFLLFKNIFIEQTMYRKQQYNLRLMFAITLGPFVT